MARRILLPLPDTDFDVTEVAVPWKLLTRAGHEVVFATEKGGAAPACDPLLLTGVVFGKLGAEPEPIAFYKEMEQSREFKSPVAWSAVRAEDFDALELPGGHAQGMKQYLDAKDVQRLTVEMWNLGRPVAAICHGVLVMARSVDPKTGKSVLAGRRSTCLPSYMERAAYFSTFWKLGRYYRTYDAYVQEEVEAALGDQGKFERGPFELSKRGTETDDAPAFVVEDGQYVSARWPGDAYLFAKKLLARLA
jgi:putative intracellular protease/amidase